MLCAVVSQPAMAESIFDLDKIPSGRLQVQQKLFQETLEGWMNNTVKDERLKLSSDLNVFFTGEDFVRLVNMGAAGVPHMVNRLYQAGFDDFFLGSALSRMLRGSWEDIAGVECVAWPPNSKADDGEAAKALMFWRNISANASAAWTDRRRAFDDRLKRGPMREEDMPSGLAEPEWFALRSMGILAVPHIMRRIGDGTADAYDLALMEMCAPPCKVVQLNEGFFKNRSAPKPVMARGNEKAAHDTAYWLSWWEENRRDYWWLAD